jgi:hypothetical protein
MRIFTADSLVMLPASTLCIVYQLMRDSLAKSDSVTIDLDNTDDREEERNYALSRAGKASGGKKEFIHHHNPLLKIEPIKIIGRFDDTIYRSTVSRNHFVSAAKRVTYINHYRRQPTLMHQTLAEYSKSVDFHHNKLRTALSGAIYLTLNANLKLNFKMAYDAGATDRRTPLFDNYNIVVRDPIQVLRFFLTKARTIHDPALAKRFDLKYNLETQQQYFKDIVGCRLHQWEERL